MGGWKEDGILRDNVPKSVEIIVFCSEQATGVFFSCLFLSCFFLFFGESRGVSISISMFTFSISAFIILLAVMVDVSSAHASFLVTWSFIRVCLPVRVLSF